MNKTTPRPVPMTEREVVTISFKLVCIDIVGLLPKLNEGHIFLLKYINVASRWPEAIPLRTKVVIDSLTTMFAWNGFPRVLTADSYGETYEIRL